MKTLTSLLLLSVGMTAFAQRGDFDRPQYRRAAPRVEGQYESLQRDGTIHRVLRLGRDGKVDLLTEFRRKNDRNARDGWIRMDDHDVERYGRLAEQAGRGRTVRQTGRWTVRDRRIVVQLDDLDDFRKDRSRDRSYERDQDRGYGELELERKGDDLVFDRDSGLYGKDKITFRLGDGRDGGRGPASERGFGFLVMDRDRLRIEGVDMRDGRDALLTIRAEGGRRIEIPGEFRREEDEMVFTIRRSDRSGGQFHLTTRGDRVVEIRGGGTYDGRRIDFDRP